MQHSAAQELGWGKMVFVVTGSKSWCTRCVTRSWAVCSHAVSQRAMALLCQQRWKSNSSVALAGAKNPVVCSVPWDRFGCSAL